jgi:hypothetical protein
MTEERIIKARLRVGPKLEVVAACILLAGLVGIAAFRNLNSGQSPAGGGQALPGQAAQPTPPQQNLPQSASGPAMEGAGDLTLGGMRATFAPPSSPAKITEAQAREATIKNIGQPPADAKVSVAYVLVTLPGPVVLNGKQMEAYPVYLVTYDGVRVSPTGGRPPSTQGASGNVPTPATGAQDVKGKITAFIDANDGEWIMGVAR